jgi:hypothetical protein
MTTTLDKIILGTIAAGSALGIVGAIASNYYQSRLSELNGTNEMITRPVFDAFNYSRKIDNSEILGYFGIGIISAGSLLALCRPLTSKNKK